MTPESPQPEASQSILAELDTFLENKTVGDPEVIALADKTAWYYAFVRKEQAEESIEYYHTVPSEFTPEQVEELPQELMRAHMALELVTRDVQTNEARIKGYAQAYRHISLLSERIELSVAQIGENPIGILYDILREKRNGIYYGTPSQSEQGKL